MRACEREREGEGEGAERRSEKRVDEETENRKSRGEMGRANEWVE